MFTPIMRRVWAAIATAVAIVAVFTVLAVAHRTPTTSATGTSSGHIVWVRSDDGGLAPVTVGSGGAHATTQISPAAGASGGVNAAQVGPVNAVSQPTTHTS